MGCHFLLQCMKVKSEREVAQSCLTQRPHRLQPTRLLRPWNCPGRNAGVGCHFLLQEIFPTKGLNLHLLHWHLPLSHPRSPKNQISSSQTGNNADDVSLWSLDIFRPEWKLRKFITTQFTGSRARNPSSAQSDVRITMHH